MTDRITTPAAIVVACGAAIILAAGVTLGLLMGVGIGTVNCQGTFSEMKEINYNIEMLKQWYKMDHKR